MRQPVRLLTDRTLSSRIRGGLVALAMAALSLGFVRTAVAEEAWEKAIRDGIADQDRELARTSPKQIKLKMSGRVARDPADLVSHYLLARAYGKDGDDASAIQTYTETLALQPKCYFALRDRGVLAWKRKDVGGAETDLRAAIAIAPDYARARQDLAAVLLQTKRAEEATVHLSRVLDAEPANIPARLQLVEAYGELSRPDDGLKTLRPLLASDSRDPGYRLLEARMWVLQGKIAEAQEAFVALARENPDSPEPLTAWLLAAERGKRGDPDTAVWVYERLARLARDDNTRRTLHDEAEKIRTRAHAPKTASSAPPTLSEIASLLRSKEPERRLLILQWLVAPVETERPPELSGDALKALMERIAKEYEPVARHRALAIVALAGGHDPRMAPFLRIGLADEDDQVRAIAASVLGDLDNLAVLGALVGPASTPAASESAAAARTAAYRLMRAPSPPPQGIGAAAAQADADAFKVWWGSPQARIVKLRAIDAVLSAEEKRPWEVLYPFVADEDPAVWTSAYAALKRVAAPATGATPFEVWMRRLPEVATGAEDHAKAVETRAPWWKGRPQCSRPAATAGHESRRGPCSRRSCSSSRRRRSSRGPRVRTRGRTSSRGSGRSSASPRTWTARSRSRARGTPWGRSSGSTRAGPRATRRRSRATCSGGRSSRTATPQARPRRCGWRSRPIRRSGSRT